MDISTLKSLFTTPSLADYLPGGSQSVSGGSGGASGILSLLGGDQDSGSSGDSVDLSSMAQQILAAANGQTSPTASASGSGSTDDQTSAKAMISGFFTDNGVDLSNLSDDAQQLLQGFQDVIDNSGATARDQKTDSLEEQYQGANRKVFTLTGNNTRLRIAVDYKDGKPQTLTLTDIVGSNLETATVSLTQGSDGTATGIQVARSQSSYLNGAMVNAATPAPLSMDLYAAS
jgi:hypothetical protein